MTELSSSRYRNRLIAFYTTHNPSKVAAVDATLAAYAGREEEMFKALVAKYGPEPNQGSNEDGIRYRPIPFLPSSRPPPPSSSYAPNGGTTEGSSPFRARLVAFFATYNPDKISTVDALLTKYAGNEEALMTALARKYGPEPSGTRTTTHVVASSPSGFRARLVAFYTVYNPDRLHSVDSMLSTYSGREEEMFAALVGKYGPEPQACALDAAPSWNEGLGCREDDAEGEENDCRPRCGDG